MRFRHVTGPGEISYDESICYGCNESDCIDALNHKRCSYLFGEHERHSDWIIDINYQFKKGELMMREGASVSDLVNITWGFSV